MNFHKPTSMKIGRFSYERVSAFAWFFTHLTVEQKKAIFDVLNEEEQEHLHAMVVEPTHGEPLTAGHIVRRLFPNVLLVTIGLAAGIWRMHGGFEHALSVFFMSLVFAAMFGLIFIGYLMRKQQADPRMTSKTLYVALTGIYERGRKDNDACIVCLRQFPQGPDEIDMHTEEEDHAPGE